MVKELVQEEVLTTEITEKQLILYNDDFNTFDWVIECLVNICGHSSEQAEQCAWIVHYKGKYTVQSGCEKDLRPKCTALTDRGLSAAIK